MTPERYAPLDIARNERGVALIIALLSLMLLTALGLALVMTTSTETLISANFREGGEAMYAADAGVERVMQDLLTVPDWNRIIAGQVQSSFTDGAAIGARTLPDGSKINLAAATNMLNCNKTSACGPGEMDAWSPERPWTANNPRWQLFVYGPMNRLTQLTRPAPCYLAVWIGDDGREQDGEPLSDAVEDASGHGIVRVHAETIGFGGWNRAIEAELGRACRGIGVGACLPGIRVQSWQELRQSIP